MDLKSMALELVFGAEVLYASESQRGYPSSHSYSHIFRLNSLVRILSSRIHQYLCSAIYGTRRLRSAPERALQTFCADHAYDTAKRRSTSCLAANILLRCSTTHAHPGARWLSCREGELQKERLARRDLAYAEGGGTRKIPVHFMFPTPCTEGKVRLASRTHNNEGASGSSGDGPACRLRIGPSS